VRSPARPTGQPLRHERPAIERQVPRETAVTRGSAPFVVGAAWAASRTDGRGAPVGSTTAGTTAATARSVDVRPPETARTRIVSPTRSESTAVPCESVAFVPTVRQTPASRAWNVTLCQGRAAPSVARGRAVTSTRRPTGPDDGAETTT